MITIAPERIQMDRMLVYLRATKFCRPDRSNVVLLDMHRYMKTETGGAGQVEFIVTTNLPGIHIQRKLFGTFPEADRYWKKRTTFYEDEGMVRQDMQIQGWHQEG